MKYLSKCSGAMSMRGISPPCQTCRGAVRGARPYKMLLLVLLLPAGCATPEPRNYWTETEAQYRERVGTDDLYLAAPDGNGGGGRSPSHYWIQRDPLGG